MIPESMFVNREQNWTLAFWMSNIKVLKRLEEKAEAVAIKGKRSYGLIARKIGDKDRLGACIYDLSDLGFRLLREQ